MILTCPECATRYLTKENAIGPNGRTVRCAKCDTTWFVASQADELALQDNQASVEDIVPEAASIQAPQSPVMSIDQNPTSDTLEQVGAHVIRRDKVDKERRRRRITSVGLIWAVPLTVLFVTAVLGYTFRQNIVNDIPQTATLYKSLGVDVTLSGLNIEDPTMRSALIDGKPVLVVNGAVRNITAQTQDVPMVELSLHTKDGELLVKWLVDVDKDRLGKNERATFVSEYPNPPVDAENLKYKFADETAVASDRSAPIENVMGVQ